MELQQFLELFHPLPGSHYMQVTTTIDEVTTAMASMMQKVDGEFRIAMYNTQEEHTKDPVLATAKVEVIDGLDKVFRALPRDNDIVVFKDIFTKHANIELLLRIAYTTLANTAEVVIVEPKGSLDIEATKALLEKFEFRAPNAMDILKGYDVLTAKKMHMWGNGL